MAEFGYSQWRKLDNAGLAFPAAAGESNNRVFRFYCQLNETVDAELLQRALDQTMEKYPLYQAVLRKGLFWFYLERRDIRAMVIPEEKPPCSNLYIRDKKSLLFEVSYYENRINFEVFHALTDGTGAMHFLQELVKNYLILAHPDICFPELAPETDVTGRDQEEDSFSQYYSARGEKEREKKHFAVQIRGERLAQDEMRITEIEVPVREMLAKARSYGVSLTVLIASMLLFAIHEEVPVNRRQHRPIVLMVPVNLRNYFPSQSMANFWGWIEVGYEFREDTTLTDVLAHVKGQFERELDKNRLAARMNAWVGLEKHPVLRAVPLGIKQFALAAGATVGSRNVTAVCSNVGIIRMPEEYAPYIDTFRLFCSTDTMQICSCTYGEKLEIGISSKLPADSIQRNFMRLLKEDGVPYQELENDFPGYKKERPKESKTLFSVFTFLCIAVVVICGMIDAMMSRQFGWSWFVTAGVFSAWLVVVVAYRKRRNLLKNEMWLLVLISVIGVLWDRFTRWRGWSVDFLIPVAALVVLGSVPVIAKVQHLEKQEYLFYLVQACAFGFIPLVLMLAGIVQIPYASILCVGISFLTLVGLFLFQKRATMQEMRKKFRI
ncbi:MAG: DUF6320 domain-containing protein [Lachnospiraceae bacterium]|nr:DUF6320 domain-containing protein [Lachnospiraceae bacterium]